MVSGAWYSPTRDQPLPRPDERLRQPRTTYPARLAGGREAARFRGLLAGGCVSKFSVPRGAVAQLGERLDRTQEVRGSSPLSSTVNCSVPPGPAFGDMVRGGWYVVADGGVTGLSGGG